MNQKLRLRNFDARNEKIETGAVVTSRKRQRNLLSVESKGQCSKGDQCSFRRGGDERAKKKNQHQNHSILCATNTKEVECVEE